MSVLVHLLFFLTKTSDFRNPVEPEPKPTDTTSYNYYDKREFGQSVPLISPPPLPLANDSRSALGRWIRAIDWGKPDAGQRNRGRLQMCRASCVSTIPSNYKSCQEFSILVVVLVLRKKDQLRIHTLATIPAAFPLCFRIEALLLWFP